MTVYNNSDQLYNVMKIVFNRIKDDYPEATQAAMDSKLIIRLKTSDPIAEVNINGRYNPIQITYGASPLRPDLDIGLTSDALHAILKAELPLKKALASGQMKVHGPIWKTPALEVILHRGQALYPQVLREQGFDGQFGSDATP